MAGCLFATGVLSWCSRLRHSKPPCATRWRHSTAVCRQCVAKKEPKLNLWQDRRRSPTSPGNTSRAVDKDHQSVSEDRLCHLQHRAVDGRSSPLRSGLRTYRLHLTPRSQESAAVSVVGPMPNARFIDPQSTILMLPNEHVERK